MEIIFCDFTKCCAVIIAGFLCYFQPDYTWGPFYEHGLTLIPAWIRNYNHYNKVWDEITHPFLKFNSATVEV